MITQQRDATAEGSSSSLKHCPDGAHSRGQMAVFLLVAKEGPGYQPPPCTAQLFNDVPCSDSLARWINELPGQAAGIFSGRRAERRSSVDITLDPALTDKITEAQIELLFGVPDAQPPAPK